MDRSFPSATFQITAIFQTYLRRNGTNFGSRFCNSPIERRFPLFRIFACRPGRPGTWAWPHRNMGEFAAAADCRGGKVHRCKPCEATAPLEDLRRLCSDDEQIAKGDLFFVSTVSKEVVLDR
jgi:hypothetical protein